MEKTLTKIQTKYYVEGCPVCGSSMRPVESDNEAETYLFCDDCLVSIDSDGGYTN